MKRAASVGSLLVATIVAPLTPGCTAHAPDHEKTGASLSALTADVRLVTDDRGVTHVYGATDADAMFGGGYAMARDRLYQMEMFRRRAHGTTAELVGAPGFNDDLGARAFAFRALGVADVTRLRRERPADAALLDAWVAGVNRRLDEVRSGQAPRPHGLGAEGFDFVPEAWTAADAAAVGKVLAFGLSNTLEREILATLLTKYAGRLMDRVPILMSAYDVYGAAPGSTTASRSLPSAAGREGPLRPVRSTNAPSSRARPAGAAQASAALAPNALPTRITLPAAWMRETYASNNWAVDGAHSANGRPWLSGDPHQKLTSPSRLWPVHLSSVDGGGTLDVVGFAFVGTPGVQLGHNARVGWTATTNFADVMDMWDVDVVGGGRVRLGDGEHAIVKRPEVIRVRRDDGSLEARAVELRDVPGYGILLPEEVLPVPRPLLLDRDALLFNWTGFRPTMELASYLDIDRAESVDAFQRAADVLEVGAVNFVAADARDILYHAHAAIPDRGAPGTHPMPWRILSGSDAATLWSRPDLGAEKLPHARNPAQGFLSTANNDPFGFTADGSVDNDPYYYGAFFAQGFRAHTIRTRLAARLASGSPVDRGDMEALQRDVTSPMAETLVPLVRTALSRATPSRDFALFLKYGLRDDVKNLVASLQRWDRQMRPESGEALVFLAFEWFAARRVLGDQVLPFLFGEIAEKSPPFWLGHLRNALLNRFPRSGDLFPNGKNAALLGSLVDTAEWLKKRFGTYDPARFALRDIQAAEFAPLPGAAFDVGRFPIGGGPDTIDVAAAPFFEAGDLIDNVIGTADPRERLTVDEMALYRMVIGFGADGVPEATVSFARGTSAEPSSPHFGDEQARWLAKEHAPLAFRRGDVDAHARATTVLPVEAPRVGP